MAFSINDAFGTFPKMELALDRIQGCLVNNELAKVVAAGMPEWLQRKKG